MGYEFCAGYATGSKFLMPVYLKIGAITTVDFLEKRFDSQTKNGVGGVPAKLPGEPGACSIGHGSAVAINGIFSH